MKRILQLLPCLYFCLVSLWCQAQEPIVISFPKTEVQPNAEFCLDVQATNFNNIEGIQFALEWKTEHLNYQYINIYTDDEQSSTYLPDLNLASNFAVKDGVLRFLWLESSSNAFTLSEKSTLFQICFKANATEAITNIQLSEVMAGEAVPFRATEVIPVIGESATITIGDDVNLPHEAVLSIGSKEVRQGENFCVPITANEFKSVASLQFSLGWKEEDLSFDRVELKDQLLDLDASNYNVSASNLYFSWFDAISFENAILPEELVLFEVCFDAIGSTGIQTNIDFQGSVPFEATRFVDDQTIDIPVELKFGIINIIPDNNSGNPTLLITDALVEPNEAFCLPILAQNMLPLTGLQFEIVWDMEKLEYTSIQLPEEDILGLSTQFNNYSVTEDAFRLAWFELNSQNIELEQTQLLFELCFIALGENGEQTTVRFGDNVALEATSIEDNVPVVFDVIASEGIVVIGSNENLVYPGDTDLDQEANHYDLINIGLGYGQTGPTRDNASLDFTPQVAEDWATSTPITNINYKHADTNGDGSISSEDTEAIHLNWTTTPTLINTAFTEEGVPFYVDTDTLRLVERNQLPIILGTEAQIAENLYSLAFSIYYEAEAMLEEGLEISLENSWLGSVEELISVQRFFPEEKRIDIAISRIDQQGVTGFGEIGALNIVMEDVILFQSEGEVQFTIDHVKAISEVQSKAMAISTQPSIAQVQQKATATTDLFHQAVIVYPNPASAEISITSASFLNIRSVELRDIFGKRVSSIYRSNHLYLEELPSGIYFLTIHTNKGKITQKINIQ